MEIVDQLRKSNADDARNKAPDAFKWFVVYQQPEDPKVEDEVEFIKQLTKDTKSYLLARGFKWKGYSRPLDSLPVQVKSRYEERARLICGARVQSPLPVIHHIDDDTGGPETAIQKIVEDMEEVIRLNPNLDPGYVNIARTALYQMIRREAARS